MSTIRCPLALNEKTGLLVHAENITKRTYRECPKSWFCGQCNEPVCFVSGYTRQDGTIVKQCFRHLQEKPGSGHGPGTLSEAYIQLQFSIQEQAVSKNGITFAAFPCGAPSCSKIHFTLRDVHAVHGVTLGTMVKAGGITVKPENEQLRPSMMLVDDETGLVKAIVEISLGANARADWEPIRKLGIPILQVKDTTLESSVRLFCAEVCHSCEVLLKPSFTVEEVEAEQEISIGTDHFPCTIVGGIEHWFAESCIKVKPDRISMEVLYELRTRHPEMDFIHYDQRVIGDTIRVVFPRRLESIIPTFSDGLRVKLYIKPYEWRWYTRTGFKFFLTKIDVLDNE